MKYLPSFLGIMFVVAIYLVSCTNPQSDKSLEIINLIHQVELFESGYIEMPITKQEYRKILPKVWKIESVDSSDISITYIVWSETPYRGILAYLTIYK